MIEFINKLLNTDMKEVSADEKAIIIGDILNTIFAFVGKFLGLEADAE